MIQSKILYRGFNTARCNVCTVAEWHATTKILRYCSGCHLIAYCGQDHQRKDWKVHKPFCRAVVDIMRTQNLPHLIELLPIGGTIVGSTKSQLHCSMALADRLITAYLGRPLHTHELYMLRFPVICKFCFRYDRHSLIQCTTCQQIFYCSKEHKELDSAAHAMWCQQYRVNFMLDNDFPKLTNVSKISVLNDTSKGMFPKDSFELLEYVYNCDVANKRTSARVVKVVSIYSYVGTILSILNTVSMVSHLNEFLCIYVVGASKEAIFFNYETCSMFFTFLPKVKTIALHFVGPEVLSDNEKSQVLKYDGNRFVRLCYYNSLFHELKPVQAAIAAHLIVCFNCGFNEHMDNPRDTWPPTIQQMINTYVNIPIAFTSYTHEEAEMDWKIMHDQCERSAVPRKIFTFKRVEVNGFKDYKPLRNTEIGDQLDELYYENGYISIIMSTVR